MASTCRLCLTTEGLMENIFTSSNMDIPKKIYECTNVEVKNLPGLPNSICEICKSELIIWYKFKRQCVKSNELLKSKFPDLFNNIHLSDGDNDENHPDLKIYENSEKIEYIEILERNESDETQSDGENINSSEEDDYEENLKTETLEIVKIELDRDGQEHIIVEEELDISCNELDTELEYNENSNRSPIELHVDDNAKGKESPKKSGVKKIVKKSRNKNDKSTIKVIEGDRVRYHKVCPICGKLQQNLKQHLLIHTDDKPFKCPHCGRGFRQRSNFKHHVYIHTGEKPYKCNLCNRAFSDPASLRSHMVGHTGERRYRCETCGNAYGHSHTLSAHRRIHTQDRRHPCEFCDKRFLSKHALKKHIRTHTGERPYKCQFCPKAFSTSGNLSAHKRVHTKEKPYRCTICAQDFGYRCVLNTHMKTHQKLEVNKAEYLDDENNSNN